MLPEIHIQQDKSSCGRAGSLGGVLEAELQREEGSLDFHGRAPQSALQQGPRLLLQHLSGALLR